MAWSKSIKAEWDRHQTLFARQWLVSMLKLKKLRPVKDEPLKELREAIEGSSQDSNVVKNMLKDVHLIEAALATDTRIASLDDKARRHFNRLEATQKPLRRVVWVNPAIKSEQVVEWLKEGAKAQRSRKLNHKRQGKRGRKRHPG